MPEMRSGLRAVRDRVPPLRPNDFRRREHTTTVHNAAVSRLREAPVRWLINGLPAAAQSEDNGVSAPDLAALVAGVKHDAECASRGRNLGYENLTFGPCDCTRDARIAKGIAAGREAYCDAHGDDFTGTQSEYDAAFARAFEEASRG